MTIPEEIRKFEITLDYAFYVDSESIWDFKDALRNATTYIYENFKNSGETDYKSEIISRLRDCQELIVEEVHKDPYKLRRLNINMMNKAQKEIKMQFKYLRACLVDEKIVNINA